MRNQGVHRAAAALAPILLLTLGCASVDAQPDAPAPPPVPERALRLDYAALYDGVSSSSLLDAEVIQAGLMDRVLVEGDLLKGSEGVEAWASDLLLAWLRAHGSRIIAPPLPVDLEPRSPCPPGGCSQPPPTAVLRQLRFNSGTDQIAVVAVLDGDQVTVAIRHDPDEASLCANDFKLPLGFVQLQALVQRLADGALAATLRETRLLRPPAQPVIGARLPDPEVAPPAFCARVAEVFETARELRRSDAQYIDTARSLLDTALAPLYTAPRQNPTGRITDDRNTDNR